MHSRLNPLIGSYRQQSPLPLALKLVRSQVRSIGLVMRLTECQADTDIIITTTNALVSLPIVALVTVLLVAFIISVLFHLYLRSPRVNPLSNTETSVKRRFEHSNESLMARSIASIFGPGAGPQGVQFSSEAQHLLTPPGDGSGFGRPVEPWHPMVDSRLLVVHAHQMRRRRFASNSSSLDVVDNDRPSLSQPDDDEATPKQQDASDGTSSDVDALGDSDSDTQSLTALRLRQDASPLAHVDGCSPTAVTEADSAHSDAGSVTTDDADSGGSQVTVDTESGFALPDDGGLTMDADEADNTLSDTPSVDADSGSTTILFHDDYVDAAVDEADNVLSNRYSDNEADDVLSDAHSVNEADDELSDVHSINEAEGALSNTLSVSGFSDTSSWITTDADSDDNYTHSDVESGDDAWVTTDGSGPEDSDNEGPPVSSGSYSFVTDSQSGIPIEDSGSQHRSFALSSRAQSRLAQLDSPALSDLAEDICCRLLGYAGSDSVADATPRRMPLSASSSSVNSGSYRERRPAAPGFVFTISVPVPSASPPNSSAPHSVPVDHMRSPCESRTVLRDAHEEPTLVASQSSSFDSPLEEGSGVRGAVILEGREAIQPPSSSSAFLDRLARLAQIRPDERAVGTFAAKEDVPGVSFSSHRRLVTV